MLAPQPQEAPPALRTELGPVLRGLARRYFQEVRFSKEDVAALQDLSSRGFVVHVMRTTAWVNYLFLVWALIQRGLPPVRAVVNLTPFLARPWRLTAQRGEFEVRFTYARRQGGSGLIFLKRYAFARPHGREIKEDPFPALVAMARRADRPVFLLPEVFVWERRSARLKPNWLDWLFGSPEAPGFVHTMVAFWRNYRTAQFRLAEPIDLKKFIDENPTDNDARIARKVRGALNVHLARETRAMFGPPLKPADRVIDETLRDRSLRRQIEAETTAKKKPAQAVEKEARRDLEQIASRVTPTVVGMIAPVLDVLFHRIYDGIEVDEEGLERALRAGSKAPLVLCSSHKSHIDYLILGWVLWRRGYPVPLVAAGSNLSFFPLGPILRRGGAYFLRRSFRDDRLYTAAFKAYVKKLVHDGVNQEFFPEGGRSRTGKLLLAKLGLLGWQVDAVLEGARPDLFFVPIAIDYEKVVESKSYRREVAGGEKKPEDLKALLAAPKVLASNYGRIHLTFDQPISLADFMSSRGLSDRTAISEDQRRGLVRSLGHRIMYGISRVNTVTTQALVSAALLAHRQRAIPAPELANRVGVLRRIAELEGARLSKSLDNAPSDPNVMGPIRDALRVFARDKMVRTESVKGEPVYFAEDDRRQELSFYKNTLMNLVVSRCLVACAVLACEADQRPAEAKERARWLSRLFKLEFIYKVGASFDQIFQETVEKLVRSGLVIQEGDRVQVAPEPHGRVDLEFLADLLRDYLESYRLAVQAVVELGKVSFDKKAFISEALETGRRDFLTGRIQTPESLTRPTLENALAYLAEQKIVVEENRLYRLNPSEAPRCDELIRAVSQMLERPPRHG